MNNQSTKRPGKNFKSMLLKAAATAFMFLLLQVSSTFAQIYARIEISNVTVDNGGAPYHIRTYGNAKLAYYSDAACTTPLMLPNDIYVHDWGLITPTNDSTNPSPWMTMLGSVTEGLQGTIETPLPDAVLKDEMWDSEWGTWTWDHEYWVVDSGFNEYIPAPTVILN